ncbi:MAG: AGE family epimerase/isomerase [Candidatus Aminicenantes bacterium]|nr:AGE family epimerase/isomerase [Candidatus Aminicenantes bacterium]
MKPALAADRREHLIGAYRRTLLDDSLPFWLEHGLDRRFGGIMTSLDREGRILDTDKGVWQQGRFAWVLGRLYNTVERRPEWLDAAESILRFLQAHAFDRDGRMFFQLARDGRPIRKRRYAFSEAFAAMAFGEHAQATESEASKAIAAKLFRAFAAHVPSPPKFTGERPMKSLAVPMIRIAVAQSLRGSIGLEGAEGEIDRAVDEIRQDFMKPGIGCCMENVGPAGELVDSFDGRLLNPGHAIEGAWFLMREGELRDRGDYVRAGCDVLDWMWERGWDREYGGLYAFRDVDDKPVAEYWHDMKFWWPHNEAVIATLLAYQLTGDGRYAAMHARTHDYAYALFPDPAYGEWFGYFHRDGRLSTPLKGNLFKGCFHVPRQALECWRIAGAIEPGRPERPAS